MMSLRKKLSLKKLKSRAVGACKERRRKADNRGLSLVEVLVAMVILALITLPIVNTFISSSKTNNQARKIENANAVGQVITERVKTTYLSNLIKSLDESALGSSASGVSASGVSASGVSASGVSVSSASSISGMKNYIPNMNFATHDEIFPLGTPATGYATHVFTTKAFDSTGSPYTSSSKGDKFYAKVTLNPNAYTNGADSSIDQNSKNNINSYNMPSFDKLDKDNNFAILNQIIAEDEFAASKVAEADINNVHRRVDVTVTLSRDGENYVQKVVAVVSYFKGSNDSVTQTVSYTAKKEYEIGEKVVKADDLSKKFNSVYLFYTPFEVYQNNFASGASKDIIKFNVVNNILEGEAHKRDRDINLYLVEQHSRTSQTAGSSTVDTIGVQIPIGNVEVTVEGSPSSNLSSETTKLGPASKKYVNLLTNAKQVSIYTDPSLNKTVENQTNSLTQNLYANTKIRYLYNMKVEIWINDESMSGNPALTLESTKENVE